MFSGLSAGRCILEEFGGVCMSVRDCALEEIDRARVLWVFWLRGAWLCMKIVLKSLLEKLK